MNVLFFTDSSYPYQLSLAYGLEKHGVRVCMSSGISRLPILGAIKTYRPDILHLHWTHPSLVRTTSFRMAFASVRLVAQLITVRLLGIKLVWTVHDLYDHERRIRLEQVINRILVRLCDQLIVHSEFGKRAVISTWRLAEHYKEKINVIPHGHCIGWHENRITREEARNKLGFGKEEKVFLYFGQIRPYKGVPSLIDAFQKFESSQVSLLIVGDPKPEGNRSQLAERCKSDKRIRTVLEGIADQDVQLYMNGADLVVLPFQNVFTPGSLVVLRAA